MALTITPLKPFGVAVRGYEPGGPVSQLEAIADLFRSHSLVVLPATLMPAKEHVRIVGHLDSVIDEARDGSGVSFVRHNPEGRQIDFTKGPLLFHFDLAFKDDWPVHIQSLYGEQLPRNGGDTHFVHCGQALDALPPELSQQLEGARVLNVFDPYAPTNGEYRSHNLGPYAERAVHDAIRKHPYLHSPVLTVNLQQSDQIIGLPREQSDELLRQVFDAIYTDATRYVHRWTLHDLILWDNRVVQHCRGDYDPSQPRCLRRVIAGDADTVVPLFRRWEEQLR